VIELGFADGASAARGRSLLANAGLGAPELAGETVRLTTHDGARLLVETLRALDGEGLAPASLSVHEPSLDDVFLALTGHRAEADVGEAA